MPPAELLPERTPHVLGCIYSVFTEGYWSTAGPSAIRDELCDEGVRLAGELCALMPDERGGTRAGALVLLHDSRRATRVDADGALVPLDEQDRSRWDRGRIAARPGAAAARPQGSTGPVSAAGGDRGAARDGADLGADRLGRDLRGLRPAARRSPIRRWCGRIGPWRSAFATAPTPGWPRWTRSPHDPRLARSSLVASVRADLLRRAGRPAEALTWYREALAPNGSEPGRASCAGASPSAAVTYG